MHKQKYDDFPELPPGERYLANIYDSMGILGLNVGGILLPRDDGKDDLILWPLGVTIL